MSPSPRSSVDVHSPTSPFLHNLSRRLRAGSSASRTSSQSSDQAPSASEQPQDARSTKQFLSSIVRDDWEYPGSPAVADQRQAISYRHRDDSVSEYESSGEGDKSDYKFDSPDDVGASIARRRSRKRRLLEQEMSWNEGLRVWTARRDAWAGAVQHEPPDQSLKRTKRTSHSSSRQESQSTTSSTSVPGSLSPEDGQNGQLDERDGPYLPIYSPLLPASHTLRLRITPNAYPTLYSKVVIQGLAPNVPIPLTHMIGALVNGWKLEGNWPPQSTEPAKSLLKKGRGNKSAFKKWKQEQEEKKKAALKQAQQIEWEQEQKEQKGKRKSIGGVVKKALGLRSTPEADVEEDLEKMGLTFETDEDTYNQAMEVLKTTQIA